nr:MAG TPA_asm: hypothetical protein [Caudoviricetes sp.]
MIYSLLRQRLFIFFTQNQPVVRVCGASVPFLQRFCKNRLQTFSRKMFFYFCFLHFRFFSRVKGFEKCFLELGITLPSNLGRPDTKLGNLRLSPFCYTVSWCGGEV